MSSDNIFRVPEVPEAVLPQGFLRDPVHFLAFGLGSGAAAGAPGTWGNQAAGFMALACLFAIDRWLMPVIA